MRWLHLAVSLAAAHLLTWPRASASSNQDGVGSFNWQRLDWRCVDASAAVCCSSRPLRSDLECVRFVQALGNRDLVAQWKAGSEQCCAFAYQQACRMQKYNADASECELYFQLVPLQQFAQSLSHKLVGVWVASGASNFVNLVCDSLSQFYPSNIAWSEEGATFNGVDSYMLMNNSMDLSGGFAWLMRVKRTVKENPFFEANDCSVLTNVAGHLWEHPTGTHLYYASDKLHGPFLQKYTAAGFLANDVNAWIDIGVTGVASTNYLKLFSGTSFVADGLLTSNTLTGTANAPVCMTLGRRFIDGRIFQGTVNAVAMANASMTEEEFRRFFELLP